MNKKVSKNKVYCFCECCNQYFELVYKWKRFCSDSCRRKAKYIRL